MQELIWVFSPFFAIFIICFVYCTIKEIGNLLSGVDQAKEDEMYKIEQKAMRRDNNASSLKNASENLGTFQMEYYKRRDSLSNFSKTTYDRTLNEMRDNCAGLLLDEWDTKAYRILQSFSGMYYTIMLSTFADVDKAYKLKSRCLKQYDAYWKWTRECSDKLDETVRRDALWNSARRQFREELEGDKTPYEIDFDSNRLSIREQIERNLSEQIAKMRPEYKRKMKIYDDILSMIDQNESIMRSELLKMRFDNSTSQEVAACYKSLVKKEKVFEIKIGNRYFCSLSDKEKERRSKKKTATVSREGLPPIAS